ncbi:MAG: hypothetical protein EOO15_06075 [Chitinophagaceae bacterium]|nr:MAG: hypothetical protein EOO15_06075 [Chitinophagaceae bacterium]
MRSYLFAALVLLAAVSCRRKDDETARLADTAPRLIAAYGIDTTLRAPADTTYKLLFTYDAAGRTASISNYSFNRPGDTATLVIEKFEYGADTLALRSTRVFRIFSPVATIRFDTIYLRHQNGALVGDSVRWQDVTSATTGVSVRRRSYRSGYIADTTYHVRISGGNADTTFETRRIWTNRVGPYFLHQLDSAEFRTASGMHFERFERTLDPTVIPNPIYAPMRVLGNPVFDAGATSFYGVFSTLGCNVVLRRVQHAAIRAGTGGLRFADLDAGAGPADDRQLHLALHLHESHRWLPHSHPRGGCPGKRHGRSAYSTGV